jgi:hypothetical protein
MGQILRGSAKTTEVTVALPVFTEAAQRPELGMPQLPAGHRPPAAYH